MKIKLICLFLIVGVSYFQNTFGQCLCNTVYGSTLLLVEKMPECNISSEELEMKINNVLNPNHFQLEDDKLFYISFIINCKGYDCNYSIKRLDNVEFNDKFIDYWKEFTNWTIPIQGDRAVDIVKTFEIKINENKFDIVSNNLNKTFYTIETEDKPKRKKTRRK
jgi:hypothetical protein